MALSKNAVKSGIRLLNLVTSHPENGRPIKELTGIVNKILPNCASLKSKSDLIVGILDAQLEKLKPERKKNTLMEILCLFFNCMLVKYTCKVACGLLLYPWMKYIYRI